MKTNKILLFVFLLSHFMTAEAGAIEKSLLDENYVERGVERLSALMKRNARNNAQGLSHLNRYVFSLAEEKRVVETGHRFIDNQVIDSMNNQLIGLAKKGIYLYVGLDGRRFDVLNGEKTGNSNIALEGAYSDIKTEIIISNKLIFEQCASQAADKHYSALITFNPVLHYFITKPKEGLSDEDRLKSRWFKHVISAPGLSHTKPLVLEAMKNNEFKESQLDTDVPAYVQQVSGLLLKYKDSDILAGPGKQFYETRVATQPQHKELLRNLGYLITQAGTEYYDEYREISMEGLSDEQRHFYDNNIWGSSQEEYEHFKDALKNYLEAKEAFIGLLKKSVAEALNEDPTSTSELWQQPSVKVARLALMMTKADYQNLSAVMRIDLLQALSKGEMRGNWLYGYHEEAVAINIVRFTPEEQLADFLEGLKKEGLLARLFSKIDDEIIGNPNFTTFVKELNQKVFAHKKVGSLSNQELNRLNYQFVWNSPRILSINKVTYDYSYDEDAFRNKDSLAITVEKCWYEPDFINFDGSNLTYKEECDDPVPYYIDDPYELISISVLGEISFLDICEENACSNQVLVVPAYFFPYMLRKKATDENYRTLSEAFNLGLYSLGAGELILAKTTLQTVIAALELGSMAITDYCSSESGRQKILEIFPEQGEQILTALPYLDLLINAGSHGSYLWIMKKGKAARSVAAYNALNESGVLKATLTDEQFKIISKRAILIRRELNSTGNGHLIDDAAKIFKHSSRELTALFEKFKKVGASDELASRLANDIHTAIESGTISWRHADVTDELAELLVKAQDGVQVLSRLKGWDATLVKTLTGKLKRYDGLGDEIASNYILLDHFVGIHNSKTWWYKYGLARADYVKSNQINLEPKFKEMLYDVEKYTGGKIKDINANNFSSGLGNELEAEAIEVIGNGFLNGGNFNELPLPEFLKNKLNNMHQEGYTVMVVEPKVQLPNSTKMPEPDMLFFKDDGFGNIDWEESVEYIDLKIHKSTDFSVAQKDFIALKETGASITIIEFRGIENKPNRIYSSKLSQNITAPFIKNDFKLNKAGKISTEVKNHFVELLYSIKK